MVTEGILVEPLMMS